MSSSTALDLGRVHHLLLEKVAAEGRVRLRDLVEAVGKQSRTDVQEVTAAVWDLVQEDKLQYGADAYVTVPEK